MVILSDILFLILSAVGIFLLIKILTAPIRWIFKLLLHAALGYLTLLVFNLVGGFFNFELPMTFLNSVIAGVFGAPGVIVLTVIRIFF